MHIHSTCMTHPGNTALVISQYSNKCGRTASTQGDFTASYYALQVSENSYKYMRMKYYPISAVHCHFLI